MKRKSKRRRRRNHKIPLSAAAGLAAVAFAKPYKGWSSPVESIQQGNLDLAFQSALANLTGITLPMGGHTGGIFDFATALNPFNMDLGAGWKTALWTSLALRIANSVTGRKGSKMLEMIPLIGKKLSFS